MKRQSKMRFVFNRRGNASEQKQTPVELEIYFNRSDRKFIPTGLSLYVGQWDKINCVVNHLQANVLNKQLDDFLKKYEKLHSTILNEGKEFSLDTLNERLGKKEKAQTSFIDFMYDRIAGRQLRDSTRRVHIAAWETLKRFGKIQHFSDLTAENIKRFDDFLRKEDATRCQVTIHGYHKRIKPYVIEAYKLRHIDFNPYNAFDNIRGTSKEREPLTQAELNHLRTIELPDKLNRIRDIFIFGCYTGLSYADIALFRYNTDVVKSGDMHFIDGERLKTTTKFYTPLLKPALDVLIKYNYKLPMISNQKYNDFLHVIEARLELKKPLTSHVARHTFATTVTLANDVPIESVSRMLGHKDIKTTQIYAKILKTTIERQVENKLSKIM